MDKRVQRKLMLKAIEEGSTAFVFHSRKLRDDQPRSCQFCGELFLPGQQPDVQSPTGPAYWRRTLCSWDCQALRTITRAHETRENIIKASSVPGVKVDRLAILERDNYVCYLCNGQTIKGYRGPDRRLRAEMDHIVPLGRGPHHPDNLACCCGRCNLEKGTKTLEMAIRISSCGDIDFDDLELVGTPATRAELVSAWKQWVLPGIDEDWEVRRYNDPLYASRWSEIYQRRIASLEAAAAARPEDDRIIDRLTLGYSGQSTFFARYGRTESAIDVLRKALVIYERFAIQNPTGVHFFSTANCVFEMSKLVPMEAPNCSG